MSSAGKSLNILGVTGSVGQCAADVVASAPDQFSVQTVSAHSKARELAAAAIRLRAKRAIIADPNLHAALKQELQGTNIEAASGPKALLDAAAEKTDLTLVAMVGMAGLRPTIAAIQNASSVAIANKEPLAAAGALVMAEAKKAGARILPIDSEHNAIFQVFDFERPEGVEKIILTASGGPFRSWSREEMASATLDQALRHPNWSMGRKITIDSATMMNKGLEIIEAHHLFAIPPDKIEVLVHPESVIHSMVEYKDGSILAQMAASDMRTPIAHALAWPRRIATPGQRLDLKTLKQLNFEQPDPVRFPGLRLAYEALRAGPASCTILNAANEIAVAAFLDKRVLFPDIMKIVEATLDKADHSAHTDSADDFEALDALARDLARTYISKT